MNKFEIQAYTKKELALLYFPSAEPHTAVNRLMSWVKRCKPLHMALIAHGYKKTAKWLSPREVALVVEHWGNRDGCRWQCGMLSVISVGDYSNKTSHGFHKYHGTENSLFIKKMIIKLKIARIV